MNRKKLLALVMAFSGCVFVTGLGGSGRISAAAVGDWTFVRIWIWALQYSWDVCPEKIQSPHCDYIYVFVRRRWRRLCVQAGRYCLKIFGGIQQGSLCALIIATAFVTAVLPYLFYTEGLSHVQASSASIMASGGTGGSYHRRSSGVS